MLRSIVSLAVIAAITVALLEAMLWSFPQLVSLPLLFHFNPELRERIADKRGLPTKRSRVLVERTDDGPPLWIYKPNIGVKRNYRDEGSVPVVAMDGLGFCNSDVDYAAEPAFDIVVIGDSFTWCEGVSAAQTWPSVLKSKLATPGIYNLGLPGVGPYEYLQLLERFGVQKSPKLVVMNLYEGNDLGNVVRTLGYASSDRSGEAAPAGAMKRAYNALRQSSVARNSITLNLLLAGLREAHAALSPGETLSYRYTLRKGGASLAFNPENADLDEVGYARALRQGTISEAVLGEPLRRFAQMGARFGFQPVVMYSPSAHSAYREHVEFADPDVGAAVSAQADRIRAFVAAACLRLGLPLLDLTDPLRRAVAGAPLSEPFYYRYNLHFTPRGHAAVADALSEFLTELPARAAAPAPASP